RHKTTPPCRRNSRRHSPASGWSAPHNRVPGDSPSKHPRTRRVPPERLAHSLKPTTRCTPDADCCPTGPKRNETARESESDGTATGSSATLAPEQFASHG